jgi:hypothetical protein
MLYPLAADSTAIGGRFGQEQCAVEDKRMDELPPGPLDLRGEAVVGAHQPSSTAAPLPTIVLVMMPSALHAQQSTGRRYP